jgi:hypothetical protein
MTKTQASLIMLLAHFTAFLIELVIGLGFVLLMLKIEGVL